MNPAEQREKQKRKEAKARYRKKSVTSLTIDFYNNTEQPLIDKVNSQPNKSGYVKGLIKKDIEEEEQNE